jgi:hypothetical protein
MKNVIQSILGTAVRNSAVDFIEGPEGPITDQADIYAHITEEWERKFRYPAGSLPYMLGLKETLRYRRHRYGNTSSVTRKP